MNNLHFPLSPSSALLFLNGRRTPLSDSYLANCSAYHCILAADGAWNDLSRSSLATSINVVVGDGDSLKHEPSNNVTHVKFSDQNSTDFEKSLRYLIQQNVGNVDVFWGSGGEMDHFLGNLSVAAKYHHAIRCRFFDEHHVYCYTDSNVAIRGASTANLSIYPFPTATLTSQGLAYEMNAYPMQQTTQQSLRNQIISDNVVLKISGEVLLFIQRLEQLNRSQT